MVQRGHSDYEESGGEKNRPYRDSGSGGGGSWILAIRGYAKVLSLVVIAVFIVSFRNEVATRVIVSGDSMNPTYTNGDVLFLWEYEFDIKRYDVVVVGTEHGDIVKRVIGLPGETVVIEGGTVYINGKQIAEVYDFFTESGGVAESKYIVPENSYFLLGDNRQNSTDSRKFGAVTAEKIKGVVTFHIFPPF